MTACPTRTTVAGRAYLDLQNLARKQGRPTDELHQIYALEGFLARLVASPYAGALVLKGGVLLAAYDTRRPTRDVDLQGRYISNDISEVLHIVQTIAGIHLDDGLRREYVDAVDRAVRADHRGRSAAPVVQPDIVRSVPIWRPGTPPGTPCWSMARPGR